MREDSCQIFVMAWKDVSAQIDTCGQRSQDIEIHDHSPVRKALDDDDETVSPVVFTDNQKHKPS